MPVVSIPKEIEIEHNIEIKKPTSRQLPTIIKNMIHDKFGIQKKGLKVRSGGGRMYSAITISYNNQLPSSVVETELKSLKSGHFDGMQDMYIYDSKGGNIIYNGYELPKFEFVNAERTIDKDFIYKVAKFLSDIDYVHGFKPLKDKSNLQDYQKESFGHSRTWNQFVRERTFYTVFPDEDISGYEIVGAKMSNSYNGELDIDVKHKGKTFKLEINNPY